MMPGLTPAMIAELNERVEADAQISLFRSVPPEFIRPFRMDVQSIGSVVVSMIPALDTAFFNRIMCLGVGKPATESMLDEAIAVLENAGCKNYMAQLSPLAATVLCQEWLLARGLKPSRNWAKMYRENTPAPIVSTDLRVERIGADQGDAFASVVTTTFEMPSVLHPMVKGFVGKPGWNHYLAYLDKKPVSAAAMFVNGEVSWLGFAGTLKKYRKRGAQGAMFTRRIQDGLAQGVKWFVTETGEDTPQNHNPSYHNMLRSGFQLAYLRRNYVHLQPTQLLHANEWARAFFVAKHTLKYEWQKLWRPG
jgi:hypothetical protein